MDLIGVIAGLLGFVVGIAVPIFILYIIVKTILDFIKKLLGGFSNGKEWSVWGSSSGFESIEVEYAGVGAC